MSFSNEDDNEDENQGSSSENEEEEGLDQLMTPCQTKTRVLVYLIEVAHGTWNLDVI